MRANIAADLACDVKQVSIKATTTERLGFAGRGEGVAALASGLLFAREQSLLPRERDCDARDRAATFPRQEIERAAVQARNALDERKTDNGARAAPGIRPRRRRARERLLQSLDILRGDPGPAIGDVQHELSIGDRRGDLHRWRAIGERVIDEVVDEPRVGGWPQRYERQWPRGIPDIAARARIAIDARGNARDGGARVGG